MITFSIIIPTKNRSQLVTTAIQSVLNQRFRDFELLIIDNDDSSRTAKVIDDINHPKITYYRTSKLSMADNWEFGISHAKGEYITILEDKQAFRKNALDTANTIIDKYRPQVLTWPVSKVEQYTVNTLFYTRLEPNPKSFLGFRSQERIKGGLYRPVDVLPEILVETPPHRHKFIMPRGLNSFTHYSLIQKIRSGPAQRLCLPITPDYTMAYQQLAHINEVRHITKPLSVMGNFSSTGALFYMKNKIQVTDFIEENGGKEKCYRHTPIKAITVYNLIVNDFLFLKKLIGGNLTDVELRLEDYYYRCFWDIALSKALGVDMTEEEQSWFVSLQDQPPLFQKRAYSRIRHLKIKARLLRAISLKNSIDLIRYQYYLKRLTRISPIFSNLIELMEWEERYNRCPLQQKI